MIGTQTTSNGTLEATPIKRVAFQGARGAFSEEAAIKLLGKQVQLVPCETFERLFDAIDRRVADYVLAPLENSLAGSVHRSYDLLLESALVIAAEVIIPIAHNLIGCRGSSFEGIRAAFSHPVALAQCELFFANHPQLKPVVADDTAASVRRVIEDGNLAHAAIAGRHAAETYGGVILREHLEDHPENYTRFALLVPRAEAANIIGDKLSLAVRLSHTPGALSAALQPFARRHINLLKIESRPVHGQPWQYRFYLDLQASINNAEVTTAVSELRELSDEVRLLGCYPSAITTHN